MKHHLQKAFTLIEILVALAVGVAVTGIGVVSYTKIREGSHDSKVKADAVTLNRAIDVFLLSGGAVPADMTARDTIQILKSVPSAQLQRETAAFRLLGDAALGLSAYDAADGRMRLVFSGGRFSAVNGGSGWLLDKSGNIPVTEESRQVYGMKFGKESKWLWNTDESSAAPTSAAGATLTLTTTAPFDGTNYRITTAGTYSFTAATTSVSGTLGLQVGPYSKSIDVSAGTQSVGQSLSVGPGSQFTLVATGVLAAAGANQSKQLSVIVDVPGTSTATPKTLEIVGASAVSVRASEGTHHENYTFLLTFTDGTFLTGPITNPALGDFTWRSDVSVENKVITDTQKGLSASKPVVVTYVPQFTVSVTATPVGAGTASIVAPNGSGVYDQGAVITVSAAPNPGFNFSSWTGGASGATSPVSITVNGNMAITANFVAAQYKLVALGGTGGTVTVSTPPTGTSPDGYPLFAAGTNVSVTASASSGFSFANWGGTNGGSVAGGASGVILMSSDKSIVANFDPTPASTYSLNVTLSDPAAGTPNGSASGIAAGEARNVSLSLNPGYQINSVTISGSGASMTGSGSENARTVTLGNANTTITYNVSPAAPGKFTLSTTADGSGTVTGGGQYDPNAVATVTANASPGWNFSHWAGANGGEVSGSIITMNGNKSVQAVFTQKMATTTWAAQAFGGSGNYRFTRITITAVGNSTPTFEQQSAGGFAQTTANLPVGTYILSAEIEDQDTGQKSTITAQIEVVSS